MRLTHDAERAADPLPFDAMPLAAENFPSHANAVTMDDDAVNAVSVDTFAGAGRSGSFDRAYAQSQNRSKQRRSHDAPPLLLSVVDAGEADSRSTMVA
jgi:hypothetical protein